MSENEVAPELPAVGVPASPADDTGVALDHQLELAPGERLLAGPIPATFTRIAGDGRASAARAGSLYLTDRRLVESAPKLRSIDLRRVTELGLLANHILVTIARSRGLIIVVDGAHELRALMAEAVSTRRKRRSELVPVMARGLSPAPEAELVEDAAALPAESPA